MSAAPNRSKRWLVVAAALVATSGVVAVAAADAIDDAATAGTAGRRTPTSAGDLAVAFDVGDVDQEVVEGVARAAAAVGAQSAPGRTGSLGLRALTRAGGTVHAPPPGYLIPMVYLALPRFAVAGVMGSDVSALLGPGRAVMGEITAGLTGARAGDVVVLEAANGNPVPIQITGIRPDTQIGSAELVFTTDVAAALGATADSQVVVWDIADRGALEAALRAEGVVGRSDTRVNYSWDPPNPDSTLSTARTKVALGEPWYRLESDGSVTMHPDWKASNLTDGRVLLDPSIRIRAQCHRLVVPAISAALAEVAAAGLGWAIDVANANAYGGCYTARFTRVSGQIGFLSRHTYGMALDTNTTTNCLGCRPQMHCDVVRIFRKHGFAWGGNFRRPDGMHFEWVGERRDLVPYPSTYCPNLVAATSAALESGPEVLVAANESALREEPHE